MQNKISILCTTGQSGSGKGTLIKFLLQACNEKGLIAKVDSLGDRLRELVEKNTADWPDNLKPHTDELRDLASKGSMQPFHIIEKLLEYIISDAETGNIQVLIVDGTPRSENDCIFWSKQKDHFVHSIIIDAPHDICFKRLWDRTIDDKRTELSVDGQPGVPDKTKIENKLSWFNAEEITEAMEGRISFTRVTNTVTRERLLVTARLIINDLPD